MAASPFRDGPAFFIEFDGYIDRSKRKERTIKIIVESSQLTFLQKHFVGGRTIGAVKG